MKKNFIIIIMLFMAMIAKSQVPNTLTREDKVFGLSKIWQEVNYNFIYLERIDRVKWDSTYRAMIKTVQETENDYEYYRELQKFCALLKDGHTNIKMPNEKGFEIMTSMFGDYRIFIQNIDGKAIIVRTNLSKKDEIPAGTEVIEVNGIATAEYIQKEVAPYISSSTEHVLQDFSISRLLWGLKGEKYHITIKKTNGTTATLKLKHAQTIEEDVYPPLEKEKGLLEFKWFENKIAYLSLNEFNSPEIGTLFTNLLPELYTAKALIIDLRFNPGGRTDIGREIFQYLTNDSVIYGAKSSSRLHIPVFKAWGQFIKISDTLNNERAKQSLLSFQDQYYYNFDYSPYRLIPDSKRIVVPTAILTGHFTASAAEDFLIYADNQKHMTKIGEKTYGSTGQPMSFDLPGGGKARICTKKDTYADGREFVGFGIKPDIEVKPTLNDFIQNNDPVLNRAISYLKQ